MTDRLTSDNRQEPEDFHVPAIPPGAEDEILGRLFRDMHMNSEEMADILERYGVMGDPDALQRAYRKRKAQDMMSRFRDDEGKRTVLAGKGGEYYVVPLCNDLAALDDVRHRLEQQEHGLHNSAAVVSRRFGILTKLIEGIKDRHRRRKENTP